LKKYAIWLTFSKSDEKYLSDIINELCIEHLSPFFTPHITVYGLVHIELGKIERIIQEISETPSFSVKKQEILQSEDFWKTVFIQVHRNKSLDKIHNALKKNLGKYTNYEFNPHISLIYKKTDVLEKDRIIKKLKIKSEFCVSGMAVQEFNDDIPKWKIVKSYSLQ